MLCQKPYWFDLHGVMFIYFQKSQLCVANTGWVLGHNFVYINSMGVQRGFGEGYQLPGVEFRKT